MGIPERSDAKHGYKISEHFWLYEGRCRCADRGLSIHDGYCGGAVIWDVQLLRLMEAIRESFGPVVVESLYRCWRYHVFLYSDEGRLNPPQSSRHLTGEAADLRTPAKALVYPHDKDFLQDNGCKGIGYYSKAGGKITHVDVGGSVLRTWDYST